MGFISPENEHMRVPDLNRMVWEMAKQIPRGMVTTYGDMAKALGDVRASRAVGLIMANNPTPIVVPCHRVVYSDGRAGWYGGMGRGRMEKERLLRAEGLRIEDGMLLDFPRVRFTDFQVEPVLTEMAAEQERLRRRVRDEENLLDLQRVAALDVAYEGKNTFAAKVVFDLDSGEKLESEVVEGKTSFPYIPGFLSYRELPALEGLIGKERGTVYMMDGQGKLHPRQFGIACHLGVFFGVSSIGVAKSHLVGLVEGGGEERPVLIDGKIAGVLLSKAGGKGVFVSPGHMISLKSCVGICRRFLWHRIPEPLREAHLLANKARSERRGKV